MISFDPIFKLHNSFLIILLNNLDLIPSYLLKLKEGLREEWLGGIGIVSEGEVGEKGGGVESCFDEMERVGGRFEEGRKERIRIAVEFLKMTVTEKYIKKTTTIATLPSTSFTLTSFSPSPPLSPSYTTSLPTTLFFSFNCFLT